LLFIEYDVRPDGEIELVALINAVEDEAQDPDGEAWMEWRRDSFDDQALGCVAVHPDELALLDAAENPETLGMIVERIILADRATKETTER
jgi:hypothetical protein